MLRLLPLIIILAFSLVFPPAAPAQGERPARPTARGKPGLTKNEQQFRAIYPTLPQTLDPHAAHGPAAWPIIMAAYHRLMTLEQGSAKPVPLLAKTYRISPDGLKYTFRLNEGMTFSDGTVVNSEALLFSFDRLMGSDVGRRFFPHLRSFEILGEYDFRLILSRPWPPFLASLALPEASVVSPGLRGRPADYLRTRTLGSGDYTVYDWQGDTIGLQIRPDSVKRPPVAFVMYHYEPDARKRYEKTLAYHVHLTVDPALPTEGPPPQYLLLEAPTYAVRVLAFNTNRPYTRMQNIRRALSFIIAPIFKDRPGRLVGPFPQGLFYNAPPRVATQAGGAVDPAAGAAIVKDIGLPPGPLTLVHQAGDRALAEDADLIVRTLGSYGLTVKVVTLEGAAGRQIMETGDYDFFLDTRAPEIPAADAWLGRFLDATSSVDGNPAFFQNARANQLIADIVGTVGNASDGPAEIKLLENERAGKLADLAAIAATEAPYVWLYQVDRPLLVDVRLKDRIPHPQWPEVWPIDSINLKPFSFRSGSNPTGRPPQTAAPGAPRAPEAGQPSSPAVPSPAGPQTPPAPRPAPPAPDPGTVPPADRFDLDEVFSLNPGPANPSPGYDDFIGTDMAP